MTDGFDCGRHAVPVSWADAFPWLPALADDGSDATRGGWVDNAIYGSDPALRTSHIGDIAALVTSRLSHLSLGEILPTLPPTTPLPSLAISNRGRNMFIRAGCWTTGDLEELTPLELLAWRGMGAGTLDNIIQALVDDAAQAATQGFVREAGAPQPHRAVARSVDQPTPEPQYVRDLRALANWAAVIGHASTPVLSGLLADCAPASVKKARSRLLGLTADDVDDPTGAQTDVATMLDAVLSAFDERQQTILSRRMFADEPVTLDQLGSELGVTRERIRQIESKARGHLLTFIASDGPLADVAVTVRQVIGHLTTLTDLLKFVPALGQKVEAVGQPAWRVLDRIDNGYEIEDGWCAMPSLMAARANTYAHLQEQVDQYGVVRLDAINLVETSQPERKVEATAVWLASCGYIVDGDYVFTRTSSVGDYAAAILSVVGAPLATQEIVDRFAFERNTGSLRNAMSIDERFERVDRDRWALSEWGMDVYAGIRSKIRERIAQVGGRAKLNDLIEFITARYSVSASSVVAYASAPPFENRDGVVSLAATDRGVRKTPERTRRLFRHQGRWVYRVRISVDHLRGSGSVAPIAIASILNLEYGETRQLETPLGPQAIAWTGNQPQFGTIRRFLLAGDIQADTEAFLVIGDDGTFAFEPTRGLTGDALQDALTLVGAPETRDKAEACAVLASAIGLPVTTPVTSIIGTYRGRGDGDIADLLAVIRTELEVDQAPEQVAHRANVDDILDLL